MQGQVRRYAAMGAVKASRTHDHRAKANADAKAQTEAEDDTRGWERPASPLPALQLRHGRRSEGSLV